MKKEYLRISEISKRLRVPEASIRSIMRRARLNGSQMPKPAKREVNAYLYDYDDFVQFLYENFRQENCKTLRIYDAIKEKDRPRASRNT